NERIRVDGIPISDEDLSALIEEVQLVAEEREIAPTFFEFTTAIAFLYFARQKVDIAVIEVGMGGDLDATNVIRPFVSVITNIGYDHTHILGKTKHEIARHKSGIFKPGSVAITADTDPKIVRYLGNVAGECGAPFYRVQDLIRARVRRATLQEQTFRTRGVYNAEFTMPLLGKHQITNACTALSVLHSLAAQGFEVELSRIQQAFRETHWEGRLMVLSHDPLVLIDGAHNEGGIRSLREFLDDIPNCHGITVRPKVLVLGLKQDKDIKPVQELIVPLFEEIIVTEGNYQAWPADDLAKLIATRHAKVRAVPNIQQALAEAGSVLHEGEMMLVTGSLYMVGDALAAMKVPVAASSGTPPKAGVAEGPTPVAPVDATKVLGV
ncbi:MAG: Mur ligase family protein, partial [Patescibacteria group bacterium]